MSLLYPPPIVPPQDVVDFCVFEKYHKICMESNASRIFPPPAKVRLVFWKG